MQLSAADVISRSIHNLAAAVSRHRPWPEFFTSSGLDLPGSFSSAASRTRVNARYFRVNYLLVIGACAAILLIGHPAVLLIVLAVVAVWLVLYFFREDPVVVWGRHVSDRVVVFGLVVVPLWVMWFTRCVERVTLGLGVGLLVCGTHAALRNPDGLFIEEEEAVSTGFNGSETERG